MTKHLTFILLLYILFSCENNNRQEDAKQNYPEINDSICADFLHQILSDTIDLRILINQNSFISNEVCYLFLGPLPISELDPGRSISQHEYVAKLFEIEDIAFVKNQFKRNKNFNFDLLRSYGYNILDTKGMREKGMTNNSILEYTGKHGEYGFYMISPPIFSKEINRAYVIINNHGGKVVLFKKVNEKWIKEKVLEEWIE